MKSICILYHWFVRFKRQYTAKRYQCTKFQLLKKMYGSCMSYACIWVCQISLISQNVKLDDIISFLSWQIFQASFKFLSTKSTSKESAMVLPIMSLNCSIIWLSCSTESAISFNGWKDGFNSWKFVARRFYWLFTCSYCFLGSKFRCQFFFWKKTLKKPCQKPLETRKKAWKKVKTVNREKSWLNLKAPRSTKFSLLPLLAFLWACLLYKSAYDVVR